jgi:uncharacterized SAM-binding protein YcdF (DUF218 family)
MLLFLSKFLQSLAYPVGLSVALAIASGIFMVLNRRRTAIVLIFSSVGLVLILSCPMVSHALVRSLESKYDSPQAFPKASAIVLLGGCTKPPVPPRKHVEGSNAGDRMINAARLLKKGYAPVIVATGGKIPYVYDFPGSEARCMASFMEEVCGIDSSSILLEDNAKDTHDNATMTAALLQKQGIKKDIILVTSAMHMYRSVKLFKKCGFTVFPAPADFRADKTMPIKIFSILPSVEALSDATDAIHEYYGLIAYRMMGWL